MSTPLTAWAAAERLTLARSQTPAAFSASSFARLLADLSNDDRFHIGAALLKATAVLNQDASIVALAFDPTDDEIPAYLASVIEQLHNLLTEAAGGSEATHADLLATTRATFAEAFRNDLTMTEGH